MKTMELRPRATSIPFPGQSSGLRLPVALLVIALLVLAPLAGRADAGASDFPSPLYLSGTASSAVTGSYKLITGTGSGASLAAPTATAIGGGSVTTGSYTYQYTLVDADGETAPSAVSNTVTLTLVPQQQQVRVDLPAGLPAGVTVRIYRRKSGLWNRVAEVPSTTTSVTDNTAEPPGTPVLPQSQNRVAGGFSASCGLTTCGYAEFVPGVPVNASSNSSPFTSSASTTPNKKGWLVDVPGPVSFAAGSWTFRVQTKSGASASGVAHLVVGLWKVTVSDGSVTGSTLLIDPNTTGEQTTTSLVTGVSSVQTVTHTVSLPVVPLAAGEYLYVQFWRRQTSPYLTLSNDARVITLYAYDGFGRIEHPLADDAAPSPFSITSPASGAYINNDEPLQSNASDPSPSSGLSVDYFWCFPLDNCTLWPSQNPIGSATWSGQPPDGPYQLIARATDNVGNTTDSAVILVNVDNTPPNTSLDSKPSDPSNGSPSFSFGSDEPGTFECSLDGGPFTSCPSPDALSGLTTGSHTFDVRAVDRAGNKDATPASFTWTVDATPPSVTFSSTPANPTSSAAASFSFGASEPSTFECRLDGAAFAACSSPRSLSGLADGSRTFEVRATDGVGNVGSASYTWTVDTTPPRVTFGSTPATPTNSTAASLGFSADEPSTFECRLDGAAFAACSSPHALSGLADGSHSFEVKATDVVGHVGSASFTWVVDTVPPSNPSPDLPLEAMRTNSLRLSAVYTGPEAGSRGRVEFRVCSDPVCANVLFFGSSDTVAKGSSAAWSIPFALLDGIYYWQARAVDLAGNVSGWTAARSFTRDTTKPGAPGGIVGVLAGDGLTLRWTAPAGSDDVGNYVVYVDGSLWRVLGAATYEVKVGPFDAGDTRTFAVSAIDQAGNEGPMSATLVGVPDLIGLPLPEAEDALETRGLVLGDLRTAQSNGQPAFVLDQMPAAPALATEGSAVDVVLGDSPGTDPGPLVQITASRLCRPAGLLRLQVRLRARANVTVRVLNNRGKRLALRRLGSLPPGLTSRDLRLPKTVSRPGRYHVVVTARAVGRSGRATASLTVKRPSGRAGTHRSGC